MVNNKGQIAWNKGLKGVQKVSEEIRQKMRLAQIGKKHNITYVGRMKLAETARRTLREHPETIESISTSVAKAWDRGDYNDRKLDLGHTKFNHNGHYHRSDLEMRFCNFLSNKYGSKLIPNYKVGRAEFDFAIIDNGELKEVIEFHPWDWDSLTLEEYANSRASILSKSSKHCLLTVVGEWTGNYAEKLGKKVVRVVI